MSLALTDRVDAPAAVAAAVSIRDLQVRIDDRLILSGISLNIPVGQHVALLGANGAGKSTLLKVLSTLLAPSAGSVELFGQSITRDTVSIRSRIGMIGHQPMLYRDLTVRENLEFFGRLYGVRDLRQRAELVLDAVGMSHRAGDPVKALSRGMTQRVAIARALMHRPDLILADEPFAGLDVPSVAALEELLSLLHSKGKTIVLVNHDVRQSLRLSQRVVVMRGGTLVSDRTASLDDEARTVAEVSGQ